MQIKTLIILVIAVIIGSCSTRNDMFKYGKLTIETQDGNQWEMLKYDSLQNMPLKQHLIYVGSIRSFHLIYFQDKTYGPSKFAVDKIEYKPKLEYEYSGIEHIEKSQFIFRDN